MASDVASPQGLYHPALGADIFEHVRQDTRLRYAVSDPGLGRPHSTSSSSVGSSDTTLYSLSSDDDDDDAPKMESCVRTTVISAVDFTVEELRESDVGSDSDVEVMQPDAYEEPESDSSPEDDTEVASSQDGVAGSPDIVRGLQGLCAEGFGGPEEQDRRYRQKKKRWSAGIFKRSHSQSIGSDTDPDDDEALDAHDTGCSARRLRRRVRGPGDRSSLIFDDPHPGSRVAEVDEANENNVVDDVPCHLETTDYDFMKSATWASPISMDLEADAVSVLT